MPDKYTNSSVGERFSYSRLALFKNCKKQYWYKYVDMQPDKYDGIEAFAGNIAHSTLVWMYRRRIAGNSPNEVEVIEKFSEKWAEGQLKSKKEIRTVSNGTPVNHHRETLGSALVAYFRQKFVFDKTETVLLECEMVMKVGEAFYTGIIDRVAQSESAITVIDYKTREGRENVQQLQGYGAVFMESNPVDTVDLKFEFLIDGTDQNVLFTRADVLNVKNRLDQSIISIRETNRFYASPSKQCHWCSYNNLCNEFKSSEFRSRKVRFRG
jgi:CRISPR/Cas system-associated exonuclease Cas4 (RecB family)